MISSRYPVLETDYFLEISITNIEQDPDSNYDDKRCQWQVKALEYESIGFSYGVDEFQCVYLAFDCIKKAIKDFEQKSGKKCEYVFFPDIPKSN